jgi:hypothetical protein
MEEIAKKKKKRTPPTQAPTRLGRSRLQGDTQGLSEILNDGVSRGFHHILTIGKGPLNVAFKQEKDRLKPLIAILSHPRRAPQHGEGQGRDGWLQLVQIVDQGEL